MQLKIKKLAPNAVIPTRAHPTDAGLDLVSTSFNKTEKYIEYGTGLAVALPKGHVGLIFPRSSVSNKDLILSNAVGVLDESYRGEIKLRYKLMPNHKNTQDVYTVGEKIGQLVVIEIPSLEVVETDDLDETVRGTGGFGSSGDSVRVLDSLKKEEKVEAPAKPEAKK